MMHVLDHLAPILRAMADIIGSQLVQLLLMLGVQWMQGGR